MAPLFDDFQKRFEKSIAMIPSSIELNGNHVVDVNINGAEAFAQMEETFKELVIAKVNTGIQLLVGKLKDKAPNGPGLPMGDAPRVG